MASKVSNIAPDCYIIIGKGIRPIGHIIRLSSIDGIEVTLAAPEYVQPIKYRILTRGGHEFEIDEPDEVAEAQLVFRSYVNESGGHVHYCPAEET